MVFSSAVTTSRLFLTWNQLRCTHTLASDISWQILFGQRFLCALLHQGPQPKSHLGTHKEWDVASGALWLSTPGYRVATAVFSASPAAPLVWGWRDPDGFTWSSPSLEHTAHPGPWGPALHSPQFCRGLETPGLVSVPSLLFALFELLFAFIFCFL